MDIIISENIRGKSIDALQEKYEVGFFQDLWKIPNELSRLVCDAKALIVRNQTKVDSNLLVNARSLRVIGRAGAGYDNIDIEAANEKGIVVCYAPNDNTISTAELSISLILSLLRKIPQADNSTKSGKWERSKFMGNELYSKTVGLLGFGKIGRAVAFRLRSFGVNLFAYDKFVQADDKLAKELGVNITTLEDTLSNSDIISIHLPLNKETYRMINYEKLMLMKKGAYLVNAARGEIIDEQDLIRVLKANILKGVALDVRGKEPPVISEIEKFENVILTPHIGALTEEAQEKVVSTVVKDVDLVLNNKPALNYVNFPFPQH